VDGYGGCPKVGPVKAAKILAPTEMIPGKVWEAVRLAYVEQGLDEAYAIKQAQVARICQYTDYDYKNKRPIPWLPRTQ
jgi:DNA polymerase-1